MGDEERFWSKVDKSGDCWVWTAGTQGRGYGKFLFRRRSWQAHRWIFAQTNGPLSADVEVCHQHMFAGTKADNMRDCAAKGRNVMQRRPDVVRRQVERARLFTCRGEAQGNSKLTEEQVADIRRPVRQPQVRSAGRFGTPSAVNEASAAASAAS